MKPTQAARAAKRTSSSKPRPEPVYVHFARPRCPVCGSHRLRAYKSRVETDGSATRYSTCRDCGRRVVVVAE